MRIKEGPLGAMERRQDNRIEKTLPVRFDFPDAPAHNRVFEALSRNIGEGGAFIETELVQDESVTLDRETVLNLEVELLGRVQAVRLRSEIVWISRKSRTPQKKETASECALFKSMKSRKGLSRFLFLKKSWRRQNLLSAKFPLSPGSKS